MPSWTFSWFYDKWEIANKERFHDIAEKDLVGFADFLGYSISELVILRVQKHEPEFA